jgi:hypothetical protein
MAIGLVTVPSGCFGESILRGGACMFEPASTSTTSSSKITERLRHAVGRCAGSSRSPQPRPPLRGLSSSTAYAGGSLSVNPRIDGSHSIFVASGTRRSWSDQRAHGDCTHSPSATLNSQPAFATQPRKRRTPEEERDRARDALAKLFAEAKTRNTHVIVERIVADIDDFVKKVRFPDWQHASQGERLVRRGAAPHARKAQAPHRSGAVRQSLRIHQQYY